MTRLSQARAAKLVPGFVPGRDRVAFAPAPVRCMSDQERQWMVLQERLDRVDALRPFFPCTARSR